MKILFGYTIVLSAVVLAQSPTIFPLPTFEFGQPSLANPITQATPNYVEGREFYNPAQIAFDTSVSPPIMYVADAGNNRVLAFQHTSSLTTGNFADLVIGQQDKFSTLPEGSPTSTLTTGLNAPTGVAVDSNGNLYVADAGNNRILRFPAPFKQTSSPPVPDLVIGQKSFNSGNAANQNGNPSATTLAFSSGGNAQLTTLAIDPSGNLWTTDPLNNRVLMYPVANLAAHTVLPTATVVVGQNDFVSRNQPSSGSQTNLVGMGDPSGLAFDSAGNLYVVDAYSRVLYFQAPFASQGQSANRVLGVAPPVTSGVPVYPSQYTLGGINSNGGLTPPNGVFTNGTNLFVADSPQNRIVEYDIPSKWAAASTAFPSPAAIAVFGQVGFAAGQVNQNMPHPTQFTLSGPTTGAIVPSNGEMWVTDAGNNRVLGFLPSSGSYSGASVVVGQTDYIYSAPNLIEGKEVYLSGPFGSGSGMVVDNSSSPPHLYVSDPGNNRILGFKNALTVGQVTGVLADIVIGQPDLKTSEINYPTGTAGTPSQTGLYTPVGIAVDNNGNLYVADSGNGRVVRFPAPFSQPAGALQTANLVLGQPDFATFIQNATANSMHSPWGVALFNDPTGTIPLAGSIAVSDPVYNRVLIFKKPSGGDFSNGQNAAVVFGQSSFSGVTSGSGDASFSTPLGIATDTSDRLYVADSRNNRIMEFIQAQEATTNGNTSTNQLTYSMNQPQAVAINSSSTELWVANTGYGQIFRFPEYNSCELSSCQPTATLSLSAAPLGLTIDGSGNLITGDSANRLTFYFAYAVYRQAANFNTQPIAPGMLALLGRLGSAFQIQNAQTPGLPWPTTLADVNVSFNGTLAPIYATSGGAIFFQVPYEAPTSGTANVIVTQKSTGAVLGVDVVQMTEVNPGFFTSNEEGTGQVVAQNYTGSGTPPINGSSNPIARGGTIIFCLTGAGQVTGAPQDGYAPPGAVPLAFPTTLLINAVPATVTYSGLGCGFPGGWQINATVPSIGPVPNFVNSVVLQYLGVPSNIGGNPTNNSDGSPGPDVRPISTTIFVGN